MSETLLITSELKSNSLDLNVSILQVRHQFLFQNTSIELFGDGRQKIENGTE